MAAFPISRRTVLKGLGVSMALPFLEAMLPKLAYSQQAAAVAFPRRVAFCYFPHGVLTRDWVVAGNGANFTLSKTLQPLTSLRQDIMVLTGLTCDKARPHGDGNGDHARASACLLTGKQVLKSTSEVRNGISFDQLVAQQIGNQTRFSSLEIGCESGRQAGGCAIGYACAYSSNLSWFSETTPAPKETNPRAVFDRLFGSNNAADNAVNRQQRERRRQSILDFVREDASALNNNLGNNDRRRVEEYLASIRDLERRISAFPANNALAARPNLDRPAEMRVNEGVGSSLGGMTGDGGLDYRLHLRSMADVLAVAFQTDMTRVSTFVFANELSNRSYPFLGVPDAHHDLTHHMFDREKMDKCTKVNIFHVEQYAYLLSRLKAMPEGAGSVLDNSMIIFGSGIGDGALHNHDNLPVLVGGKGGGTIASGRHLRYPHDTPICNLYLDIMDRMNVRVDSFGDSTGRLRNLN